MLILLDENIPHKFRHHLVGHEVRTAVYQGWASLVNGELLKVADAAGFDIVITADQGIPYQQNLTKFRVALIILSDGKEPKLMANLDKILETIRTITHGTVLSVKLT